MQFSRYIPVVALGLMVLIGSAAHAASTTDYQAFRSHVSVTALGSPEQIVSQFPGRGGQVIEVEGIVNGVFSNGSDTGFLLQLDPNQTIILTAKKDDPDIAIASRLRVLARVPEAGTVLQAVSWMKVNPLGDAAGAAASDNTNGRLTPPSAMPVEQRPPVIYYQGSSSRNNNDDTASIPYANGAGQAQKPEVVQRYAQKIMAYNAKVSDDVAMKIAFHLLDKSVRYGVDPRLTLAVIAQESRFNPNAVSSSGAQGLGQLMPRTAELLGVHNSFDIADNLDGTVRYLGQQLQAFGRVSLALAAYNAGPGNVKRYGGVPPFHETQNYVQVIWQNYTNIASEFVN